MTQSERETFQLSQPEHPVPLAYLNPESVMVEYLYLQIIEAECLGA